MNKLRISIVETLIFAIFCIPNIMAQDTLSPMEYYYHPKNGSRPIKMKPYVDTSIHSTQTVRTYSLIGETAEEDTIKGKKSDSIRLDYEYANRIGLFHRGMGFYYLGWDPFYDYYGWNPYWEFGFGFGWYGCWDFCYDDWGYGYDGGGYGNNPYRPKLGAGHGQLGRYGNGALPEGAYARSSNSRGSKAVHSAYPTTRNGERLNKPARLTQNRQAIVSGRTSYSSHDFAHNSGTGRYTLHTANARPNVDNSNRNETMRRRLSSSYDNSSSYSRSNMSNSVTTSGGSSSYRSYSSGSGSYSSGRSSSSYSPSSHSGSRSVSSHSGGGARMSSGSSRR